MDDMGRYMRTRRKCEIILRADIASIEKWYKFDFNNKIIHQATQNAETGYFMKESAEKNTTPKKFSGLLTKSLQSVTSYLYLNI